MAGRAAITSLRRRPSRLPRVPNYYLERQVWATGLRRVAGVDEAGRGAWAGPIVAAAVVLPAESDDRRALSRLLAGTGVQVNDSKKLDPISREALVNELLQTDIAVAVVSANSEEIDHHGVGYMNAALLRDAALDLMPRPDFVLSDAFSLPDYGQNQRAVVAGDRRSKTIALASCVAKVMRDRMMIDLDREFPGYGFAKHKGYGTAQHRDALEYLGVSPVHRRSFAPIQAMLDDGAR